jgi:peptidoglycan hydrolase-like protein with peptidoglycan-binding domain
VSLLGRMGRQPAALFRHRGITAIAGAAVIVLASGGTFAAVSSHKSTQKLATAADSKPLTQSKPKPAPPVGPLQIVSVSPDSGTKGVNGAAAIKVTFSSALAPATPLPALSPKIAGSWSVSGKTVTFTPSFGYLPDTNVTLKIPGGLSGMQGLAASAGTLAQASTVRFTTGTFSTLRLQQVLSQLGYLPLTWTPTPTMQPVSIPYGDENAQLSAAYAPPAGTFAFQPGYPSALTSQWKTGADNMLDQGAIRAFESNEGITMDGIAGPQVWADLLKAAANDKTNPNGYTYALVSQKYPESITVWHNGRVIEHTLANTGIPGRDTQDGTFPVYLRYQFNYMDGTNPDGTKYHDPVWWISYFNAGDAVHYFPRYSYGSYQSLGCVELQWDPAKKVWSYMTYGTLVTVTGPMA